VLRIISIPNKNEKQHKTDTRWFLTCTHVSTRMKIFENSGVNFINILSANFRYKSLFASFFYLHETREKLPRKRCSKNVDEIDTCSQFHQHFTYKFFVWTSFRQLFPRTRNVHVTREKAAEMRLVQKFVSLTLMKLTTNLSHVHITISCDSVWPIEVPRKNFQSLLSKL